jgi:hypothetical protein
MSGAFPISSAKFQSLGITSIQNTIISKSVSGKKLARQIDNQRFAFTIRIITGTRSDVYGELMAFIIKQRSGKENFTIIPPEVKNARGNETGTILVNGSHAVGDTTIAVDGHANNNPNAFKSGDFIKFASHNKVYMIVADVQASGNASTLTIEPPLLTALSDNSAVIYDNVPFTVHLTNDVQEFGAVGTANDGAFLYQFEFDVEETL